MSSKTPIWYMQTDVKWATSLYAAKGESCTIRQEGCGPTCAAMVVATLKDKKVTPPDACKWSLDHGYKALHSGTYYSYFKPYFAVYGLKCTMLNGSSIRDMTTAKAKPYHESAKKALKAGDYVIACMGKGLWTVSGHFILLYKLSGDKVYIRDPWTTKTECNIGSWKRLKNEVKYYFVIDVPEEKVVTPVPVPAKPAPVAPAPKPPAKPAVSYYKKSSGLTLTGALDKIKVNSSYANRAKIAKANGITGYKGTAGQNNKLLKLLKAGKLKKA